MLKFEYRGLDLMDQVASVPVALDGDRHVLHIKDKAHVVWPDYRGAQGYILSDAFLQMVTILRGQHLFKAYADLSTEEWIRKFTFYFYKSDTVLLFIGNKFVRKIPVNAKKNKNSLVFSEWIE